LSWLIFAASVVAEPRMASFEKSRNGELQSACDSWLSCDLVF